MTPPLSLEQAQARLLDGVESLPAVARPAEEAVGRFLAAPAFARRTQPAADLSAMDGYAVRADDLAGPWTVVGESAAGHPYCGSLQRGAAVRISTGALMPEGAGAVLLQENAARDGERLSLANADGPVDRHIRREGFDFQSGDTLLEAGTRIGPAQLALAISGGCAVLDVHRRPRVAVLDSGDELVGSGAEPALHQIPASNGAMLAAMAAPWAESVARLGPVRDTMEAMLSALDQAGDAEVIVTSGGASVGDHDLVRPALEQWGATIDFWRVAIRPGKPLLVARKGPQWIIGLPGNPVSSYVTAFLFLLPLLRRLAGAAEPLPVPLALHLAGELPPGGDRSEFIRGQRRGGMVVPLGQRDSSALRTLAAADALIRRDIGAAPAAAGDEVTAYLLENGGIA